MTRDEHVAWCKERALAYLVPPADLPVMPVEVADQMVTIDQISQALASFTSDMNLHDETRTHPALSLGLLEMMLPVGNKAAQLRKWIQGFN